MKCTGLAMIKQQCPYKAKWINQNGVTVCNYHRDLLDAFTWESRNTRQWKQLEIGVTNEAS